MNVASRPSLRSGSGEKVGSRSGGGGTTPSPGTLEVEPVSVVWSETTTTSAWVGEV